MRVCSALRCKDCTARWTAGQSLHKAHFPACTLFAAFAAACRATCLEGCSCCLDRPLCPLCLLLRGCICVLRLSPVAKRAREQTQVSVRLDPQPRCVGPLLRKCIPAHASLLNAAHRSCQQEPAWGCAPRVALSAMIAFTPAHRAVAAAAASRFCFSASHSARQAASWSLRRCCRHAAGQRRWAAAAADDRLLCGLCSRTRSTHLLLLCLCYKPL